MIGGKTLRTRLYAGGMMLAAVLLATLAGAQQAQPSVLT